MGPTEHYTQGMSYTALARRYRSTGFDDIVGQEPIARTLQAAIKADRVAHAYLFTGTRGVGKTTMARVFAKALNEGGEEIEKAIMSGQDTDVIEIDGASNNSVDDARELIANSVYRPMRGPYKIYIIDEVHMLSTAAFNALLKTMEEPPEHVKFILCTTEAHKVPPTIQSRCQRYDFRAIPMTVIADRLGYVVENEKLKAEPELLTMVARLGNGSMRDALSIMDRLMASGEKKLTVDLLESLMGLAPRELVGNLIDAFADGEPRQALDAAGQLVATGTGPDQLFETLIERLRDLMVLSACGPETSLVELTGETRKEEVERSQQFDAAGIVHMIALCENAQRAAKSSPNPRALLDALIVRLAMTEKLADVTTLVAQLKGQVQGAGAGKG
ncbi:MAG: DNA polymerase III subunit gamma/tau [Phycisphaera sp.]|nr:MAG: DNA polymerase III subunit gamma/tau [Phycisphaera sp.]